MQSIGVFAVTAYTAHKEWATRPPDERYASVSALYDAARARRDRSHDVRELIEGVLRQYGGWDNPM